MLVVISFYDNEVGRSEPSFVGDEGKARDHLAREHILPAKSIDELFTDGYSVHKFGEFYWEELNG